MDGRLVGAVVELQQQPTFSPLLVIIAAAVAEVVVVGEYIVVSSHTECVRLSSRCTMRGAHFFSSCGGSQRAPTIRIG